MTTLSSEWGPNKAETRLLICNELNVSPGVAGNLLQFLNTPANQTSSLRSNADLSRPLHHRARPLRITSWWRASHACQRRHEFWIQAHVPRQYKQEFPQAKKQQWKFFSRAGPEGCAGRVRAWAIVFTLSPRRDCNHYPDCCRCGGWHCCCRHNCQLWSKRGWLGFRKAQATTRRRPEERTAAEDNQTSQEPTANQRRYWRVQRHDTNDGESLGGNRNRAYDGNSSNFHTGVALLV